MPATELWDLAQETLDAVVAAFVAEGVALPSRRYVAAGTPVDDCEQLVVWLGGQFTGLPAAPVTAPERFGLGYPRSVQLNVRITRCVVTVDDDGNPPSTTQLEASAQDVATDLWVLPQGLIAQHEAGSWIDKCQDVVFGPCTPFEWSGGVGGVELGIVVQIDASL